MAAQCPVPYLTQEEETTDGTVPSWDISLAKMG
jgi:hypothetical protein